MNRPAAGCNAALVEEVFDLLYQRTWFSQHDPRSSGLYAGFRRNAMLLAKELSRTELAAAGETERRRIVELAHRLEEDSGALLASKVISSVQDAATRGVLERILAEARRE